MASSWMLLLAVLGGACALPAPVSFTYTQALAEAVNSYNKYPEVKNAFRLLSAEPQPDPGVELSSLQSFSFSMMETECAASARSDPEDCAFKENGVILECLATVKMQQESPDIDLKCSDASSDISSDDSSDASSDISSDASTDPGLVESDHIGGFGSVMSKASPKFGSFLPQGPRLPPRRPGFPPQRPRFPPQRPRFPPQRPRFPPQRPRYPIRI
ncbi:cathelicidin-2-like [Catharus ustulatus]|uniref:cathelicidin-2-like n=1 Tax=Catharus ustulatus TaxID=91951 RepID=UPI0014089EB7|nr:cathelicidin-2-like [Catharus ustulatus]